LGFVLFVALWLKKKWTLFLKNNRLSLLSKWAVLTGKTYAELEGMRYNFFPCQEKPTDALVVSFAGGAMQVGRHSVQEFRKTINEAIPDCDQLYLADPQQSYYLNEPTQKWDGFDYHQKLLRDVVKRYKTVVFIGNCLGGTGAILFAHLADVVIAFNPLIDLNAFGCTSAHYWAKRRFPPAWQDNKVLERLKASCKLCRSKGWGANVTIHSSNTPSAVYQAKILASTSVDAADVVIYDDCRSGLPQYLKKHDKLVPLVAHAYNKFKRESTR